MPLPHRGIEKGPRPKPLTARASIRPPAELTSFFNNWSTEEMVHVGQGLYMVRLNCPSRRLCVSMLLYSQFHKIAPVRTPPLFSVT